MKFKKIISSSIIATTLLGITLGGAFSSANVSGSTNMKNPVSDGNSTEDSSKTFNQNLDNNGQTVSKDFKSTNNTNVNITDGYLNLDSTPTFDFGNNKDAVNNGDAASNGNTLGLNSSSDSLQVTDYRASSQRNSNPTNWHLSAKVEPFSLNGQPNNSSNTHSQEWKMNFTPSNATVQSDKNTSTTLNQRGIQSNSSDQEDIMDGGYGSTNINYNTNSANKLANLNVPYNVQPGPYTSSIDWNLATQVGSKLN